MKKSDNQKIIMTKDFENWLKQDNLFEHYQNNPDQQQTIFIDYKREKEFINPKDEKGFSEWMPNNTKAGFTDSDYIEMYEIVVKIEREKSIKKLDDELNSVDPSEALAIVDKLLYGLRKKELLAEIDTPNADWNDRDIWFRKYLLNELDHQQKRPSIKPPKQQKRTTYQWQGNAGKELPELYSLMINKYKLIASDTTLEQFTAIFTGQPIKNIKPIKWNVSKTLNAYFIEQLINKNKLSKAINIDIWVISKYCFSNGANFSQSIDNYKNSKTGKPSNYNLIDDLLNAL
tara:strand:- start:85 stop:948 length:864 start_codon:yes stop_codon:yes gene_type:complete